MRALAGCILALGSLFLVTALPARQADSNDPTATASCDFEDGMQITAKYNSSTMSGKDLPRNGKLWMPGGSPITFFTQVPVILDHIEIPVGAYSVYVIPDRKEWTLIVNKNVASPKTYDDKQYVVRASIELGGVDSPPKQLHLSFAHVSPKVCSIRLYYETTGAFVDFTEK